MKEITDLHERVDAINAKLVAETARLGKPVTCPGKGCCACCYEPVYCSSDEVRHMLEGLTDKQKEDIASRLKDALSAVRYSGLFDKDMPPVIEWLALMVPCPFLVDGQCSVYERRPVSCRSHMAVGPPEWCSTKRLEQKYPGSKEVSFAIGQAVVAAYLKIGNIIHQDNLLALLSNELLGEYAETASAHQIVFVEENKERTENGREKQNKSV